MRLATMPLRLTRRGLRPSTSTACPKAMPPPRGPHADRGCCLDALTPPSTTTDKVDAFVAPGRRPSAHARLGSWRLWKCRSRVSQRCRTHLARQLQPQYSARMANVFISHRGADSPAAERLAKALRAKDHDVWLDKDEIHVGDSIIGRIGQGLSVAGFLVLLIGDGMPSKWVDAEWMSMLARQFNNETVRLLPARIGKSQGPAIIADIRYANLAADWDKAVTELDLAMR